MRARRAPRQAREREHNMWKHPKIPVIPSSTSMSAENYTEFFGCSHFFGEFFGCSRGKFVRFTWLCLQQHHIEASVRSLRTNPPYYQWPMISLSWNQKILTCERCRTSPFSIYITSVSYYSDEGSPTNYWSGTIVSLVNQNTPLTSRVLISPLFLPTRYFTAWNGVILHNSPSSSFSWISTIDQTI